MSTELPVFEMVAHQSTVEVYDSIEFLFRAHAPIANPFVTVTVEATITYADEAVAIEGFCDSQEGSIYRVRFMPKRAGHYAIDTVVRIGETVQTFGTVHFVAIDGGHKGMLEVDPELPHHFRWSGTHDPFFWNATTTYLLAGLSEEKFGAALERLAGCGINRVRVSLCPSRQKNGGRWGEAQVGHREDFSYCYSPWLCAQPDSWDDPQPDTSRFDVAYWQKFERLLTKARSLGIIVQVISFTDAQEKQNYPFDREKFGDDPAELRYYSYGLARLGSFSNVEYCLTNEWRLFRPDAWAENIGNFVESKDVYDHATSIHGHEVFPFIQSKWADFALFQVWDEGGSYEFMRTQRRIQDETGTLKPQINEEYGYEDHYPGQWGKGKVAPARSADTRRRLAWEMTMAGCYQTTGESAANGIGGWINGLGDDSMTMLEGYRHLVSFFTALDWRRLEPMDSPVSGVLCLAGAGGKIVCYLTQEAISEELIAATLATISKEDEYGIQWYNPRNGQYTEMPDVAGDWVCLMESKEKENEA